jgi:hypothetical protein
VTQSHRRWREGNKLAVITSKRRPPVGTMFSFTLNKQAPVSFVFTHRVCKHHHCRTKTPGALSFTAHTGLNKVTFEGRVSKHKKLNPGRYTLIVTARNAAGGRATAKLTFTIVG